MQRIDCAISVYSSGNASSLCVVGNLAISVCYAELTDHQHHSPLIIVPILARMNVSLIDSFSIMKRI